MTTTDLSPADLPAQGAQPSWRPWAVLAARLLLGGLFVVSGVSKVLDARSFIAVLPLYQLPAWLMPLGALLPTLEAALGVALILGIAPRLAALAALGALALFSAMLIMGMIGGKLETCGCFGRLLEASPTISVIRNLLFALLGIAVWRYHRRSETRWRPWQVGMLAGILLTMGTLAGYTVHAPLLDPSLAQPGTLFPDEGFGEDGPMMEGRQLAFVFSVTCEHCWNSVANVKALASELSDYGVMGVTNSARHELSWFIDEFQTNFPIYTYDPNMFTEAFRTWPALYVLEDGLIIGKVDNEVPSPKTLLEVHLPLWR